jgi:hypothetical protein
MAGSEQGDRAAVMDIRRISDELEINALLSRYARAVDTKDWTLFGCNCPGCRK